VCSCRSTMFCWRVGVVYNYGPDKQEGVGLSRSVLGSDLPYLNPCQSS
jgi:hypothetical protein